MATDNTRVTTTPEVGRSSISFACSAQACPQEFHVSSDADGGAGAPAAAGAGAATTGTAGDDGEEDIVHETIMAI